MLTASLDQLLPADHPVRTVQAFVARLDLSAFDADVKAVAGETNRRRGPRVDNRPRRAADENGRRRDASGLQRRTCHDRRNAIDRAAVRRICDASILVFSPATVSNRDGFP
jgi:hypothetical protein